MHTEFRRTVLPAELRSLVAFDHKVFRASDWFNREDWEDYESWWMLVAGVKVGCCAFERHVDFTQDLTNDANPPLRGSLYISSTGILPRFQRKGFGALLKSWQVSYARYHRFHRIVTNVRQSNAAIRRLNQAFHFRELRTTPGYYRNPREATVVMELAL